MPIYTRAGDAGHTVLPGPEAKALRLRKDDIRLEALGDVDELNAVVGLCLAEAARAAQASIVEMLLGVQDHLLRVGAIVAAAGSGASSPVTLDRRAVEGMERAIDAAFARCGALRSFLLPGGCELAARLHLARTVARRAERSVVAALASAHGRPGSVVRYLNRLSDLLFALARQANHDSGTPEARWRAPGG